MGTLSQQYGSAIAKYEKVTVTIPVSVASVTQNLSFITNHAMCVPFATARGSGTSVSYQGPGSHNVFVEMINNAGVPAVRVSRGNAQAQFGQTVIVYVVQFDPAYVRVTQSVSTGTASTINHTIPTCVLAKTFVLGYFRPDTALEQTSACDTCVTVHLSSVTNVVFTRGTGFNTSSHKFASYAVEDISSSGVFDVQHITRATDWWGATNDATVGAHAGDIVAISSIATNRSFILGSYRINSASNGPITFGYSFYFSGATGVYYVCADRNASFDVGEMRIQVVTFLAGIVTRVTNPIHAFNAPFTGASATITLATGILNKSIVISPTHGAMCNTMVESSSNNANPRMASTYELTSATQVTVTPSVGSPGYNAWGACFVLEFLY